MKSFHDKVAIVTGGGGNGIGNALVRELVSEGAHVAFCDIAGIEDTLANVLGEAANDAATQLTDTGRRIYNEIVDMGDKAAIDRFVDNVLREFGHVDILINNAGIALGDIPFDKVSVEDFEKITDINYWGVVHTTQRLYSHMLQRPEAAIANLSSTQGILAAPHLVPYCTTKFAVRGFTDALRIESKLRGFKHIGIHTVHPGAVATNITLNADHHGNNTPKFHEMLQKRGVSPQKAAQTILKGIRKKRGRIFISDGKTQDRIARLLPNGYSFFVRLMLKINGGKVD